MAAKTGRGPEGGGSGNREWKQRCKQGQGRGLARHRALLPVAAHAAMRSHYGAGLEPGPGLVAYGQPMACPTYGQPHLQVLCR